MAKRFEFRLEALLTLRKRREDEQRRIVAESVRDLGRSRDVLAALQERVEQTLSDARCDREGTSIDASTAMLEQRWRAYLKQRVVEQHVEIQRVALQVDLKRGELARRATERKAIEKLRERRLADHVTAAARQERFAEDEVAATVCLRQARDNRRATLFGG